MTDLGKQLALVFVVLVCVAAMPFRATVAPEASPCAGLFASEMLKVGKARWEREGRTRAGEFADAQSLAATPALLAAIPQNPVGGGSQGGQGGQPVETMGGATNCPVEHTHCPAEATLCPISSTNCPVQATVCKLTECPAVSTHCPVVATTCQSTVCPASATFCPVVGTACPAMPTACPVGSTSCPVVATACPVNTTTCPNTETQCQTVATECPLNYTTCPFTETTCDTSSTECFVDICLVCISTRDAGPPASFRPPTAFQPPADAEDGSMARALMVIGSPAPVRTIL